VEDSIISGVSSGEVVDRVVGEKTSGLRGPFTLERLKRYVGLVAHVSTKEALATATDIGPSLNTALGCLGVTVGLSFGTHSGVSELNASRKIVEPIPVAEREKYGYGDLPDELIHDVEDRALFLLPDYVGSDQARRLAALTMHIVRICPDITPQMLWHGIAEKKPLDGIRMALEVATAYKAIVETTHKITANHPTTPNHLTEYIEKGDI